MKLADYINEMGQSEFAKLHGISRVQAHYYTKLKATPKPKLAKQIVEFSHGVVSYEDIYAPIANKTKKN